MVMCMVGELMKLPNVKSNHDCPVSIAFVGMKIDGVRISRHYRILNFACSILCFR